MPETDQITRLLLAWKSGDEQAAEQLIPLVEAELRRIARAQMRRERDDHTLQTTALINEAYLKLVNQTGIEWQNRSQFFGISATIMRRVLLNYARDRRAGKRGGGAEHADLEDAIVFSPEKSKELIELDEALQRLEKLDRMKSRIVEMRYFAGLSVEETAQALDVSPSTVSLHWRMARAWLQNELDNTNENKTFRNL